MKLVPGVNVESLRPTSWPNGKIQRGVIATVEANRTPLGGRDADTCWVQWNNGGYTGPWTGAELREIEVTS